MKTMSQFLLIVVAAAMVQAASADQVGVNPVPVVTGVSVQTNITFDSSSNTYTYSYSVTNPATNTGNIWNIQIDLSAQQRFQENYGTDLTLPRGAAGNLPFSSEYRDIQSMAPFPMNSQIVPFGITAPQGWIGSITVGSTGGFAVTNANALIAPGQTLGNLNLLSHGVPTIRAMQLIPDWVPDMGSDESSEDEQIAANQIQQSLINHVYVLGPSPIPYDETFGFFDALDQLQSDLATAVQIGWIPDATLTQSLPATLQAARTLYDNEGPDYNA